MRNEALKNHEASDAYCPVLIGERLAGNDKAGKATVDIAVYTDEPEEIVKILKAEGVMVLKNSADNREQAWINFGVVSRLR